MIVVRSLAVCRCAGIRIEAICVCPILKEVVCQLFSLNWIKLELRTEQGTKVTGLKKFSVDSNSKASYFYFLRQKKITSFQHYLKLISENLQASVTPQLMQSLQF